MSYDPTEIDGYYIVPPEFLAPSCATCGVQVWRGHVTEHALDHELGVYRCPTCQCRFHTARGLNVHRARKHPRPAFPNQPYDK